MSEDNKMQWKTSNTTTYPIEPKQNKWGLEMRASSSPSEERVANKKLFSVQNCFSRERNQLFVVVDVRCQIGMSNHLLTAQLRFMIIAKSTLNTVAKSLLSRDSLTSKALQILTFSTIALNLQSHFQTKLSVRSCQHPKVACTWSASNVSPDIPHQVF